MSVLQALDIGLSALVLAVAVWTIAAREAVAAVVGYVAYGLLLSLVWVRLFAVDVALTEAAIGGGVTGVLLIGAAARLREAGNTEAAEQPNEPQRFWAGNLFASLSRRPLLPSCYSCPIRRRRWLPRPRKTSPRPASATRSPPF
jgi:uncharacterized MnhB-related membrane protein